MRNEFNTHRAGDTRAKLTTIELLEKRMLRSATLGDFGILTVNGTAHADRIAIYLSQHHPDQLWVKINGKVQTFNKADVLQVQVYGKGGSDWMEMNERNGTLAIDQVTSSGDGGNDTIIGGGQKDFMQGGSGNDVMAGNGGADNMHGGQGNDVLDGGNGNDHLNGGDGADTLRGGAGDDKCFGNSEDLNPVFPTTQSWIPALNDKADRIYGGAGNDVLSGQTGNDFLFGGSGKDTLNGGTGRDQVWGGAGTDSISGGRGADHFSLADAPSENKDVHAASDDVIATSPDIGTVNV